MTGTTDPIRSPREAADDAIAADARHADPALWITRLPDDAIRAAARALEAEGKQDRPLWGVPFAVKDNIDVAGLPTTAACPAFAYTPRADSTAVARLRAAGALLIGKTNMDQFATGLVGTRSPYGVPRNAIDAARVPGGSSSGSAWAVAAGIVQFALGTDTAGSGRVPAMFAGIVGLKPTPGSVSASGTVPACRSLDTISVFANTVSDALAIQRIIAGYDDADPFSRPAPFPHLRAAAPPPHPVVAVARDLPACEPFVEAACADAAARFDTVAADIAPFLEIARLLYDGPWVAERTASLRAFLAAHPDAVHPVTRQVIEAGLARTAADAFDAFHRHAEVRREADRLFARADALLLPTAPFCPTLAEDAADPFGPNARLGTFTNFVNLCGLAAIAVPAGPAAPLPGGVMLIGPAWSEGRLAALAQLITGEPASADPIAPDETALFCVGAHMSGLPLNHQILALGGRFLRVARTIPAYRLFALDGRPGLIRTATDGAAIAGETWALPTAAIGALLAQIPAPLGFGTVALHDGPCLGFLAEAHALAGAPDITRHGGWRAWIAETAQ